MGDSSNGKLKSIFFLVFIILIIAEILKGLSTTGTPPFLQDYDWQIDLAYIMWSSIPYIRIILGGILIYLLIKMTNKKSPLFIFGVILMLILWGLFYWFFNHFWNGGHKFPHLENPNFTTSIQNKIDPSSEIIGIDLNGVQKAYPVNMVSYHHQITDYYKDQPVWVTYCGLCRSGRVYDLMFDGQEMSFNLAGAINYNATFKDNQTGSWWFQETGEAVKGKYKGQSLEDIAMEQMSLENWLAKYPNSQILQYDPQYQKMYKFVNMLREGEAEFPVWYTHVEPDLIIGLEIGDESKAYDWEGLKNSRLVLDQLGDKHIMLLTSEDGVSPFAYNRTVDGNILEFEINGDTLKDKNTQSTWNLYGFSTEGELQGTQLESVQIYQQNIRSWKNFHEDSSYYNF